MFNFLFLSQGAVAFLQNIAVKFLVTMSSPCHTRDYFRGDCSLSFSVCLNYQNVMVSTSAGLMKNIFHTLRKLNFDTVIVLAVLYCTLFIISGT